VETDHAHEAFTMNWKLTRRGRMRWQRDQPICQIVPFRTSTLADWRPEIIDQIPDEIASAFWSWAERRTAKNEEVSDAMPYAASLDYRRRAHVRRLRLGLFSSAKPPPGADEPPIASD